MGLDNLFKCFEEMEAAKSGSDLVQNVNGILPSTCEVLSDLLGTVTSQVESIKIVPVPAKDDADVKKRLDIEMAKHWKDNKDKIFTELATEFSEEEELKDYVDFLKS